MIVFLLSFGLKKLVLNSWFSIIRVNLIVSGGNVNKINVEVINVVYVNKGSFM